MTSDAATYVYCVVEGPRPDSIADAPPGLSATDAPRLLDAGERLWVVVADAPLAEYGSEAIERGLRDLEWVSRCAVAHESVVEHFLGDGALVPMKLFTLFSSDERCLADVRSRRAHVQAILAGLRGRHEWGIRVFHDRERALGALRERAVETSPSSGTAFLLRKKEERDTVERVRADGRRRAEEIHDELAARAERTRRFPVGEGRGRLVLDAAFLVPTAQTEAFQGAARRCTAALAPEGFDVVLSGPWPAYNFAEDDAEVGP
jgi:hypothetical protein